MQIVPGAAAQAQQCRLEIRIAPALVAVGAHQQEGYAGRTGLFEIMTMNQEIRRLIAASAATSEIEQAAIGNGMIEFRRSAMLKVAQGVTSTEEILRDVPAEYLGLES